MLKYYLSGPGKNSLIKPLPLQVQRGVAGKDIVIRNSSRIYRAKSYLGYPHKYLILYGSKGDHTIIYYRFLPQFDPTRLFDRQVQT